MAGSSKIGADAASSGSSFAAEDLACTRGGRVVFEVLSFRLEPGDALVLRGPNGSGKSTLLRLLAGFLRPSAGSLAWDGDPIAANSPEHRARLHFVGHADPLKPLLTVAENLAFAAGLADCGEPVGPALAEFGLEAMATTPARFLSSGQKTGIARASPPWPRGRTRRVLGRPLHGQSARAAAKTRFSVGTGA